MAGVPVEVRELIESGLLGHLVTLNPDGPPGLKEYLVVHGRARVEEGGAPPDYTMRITVERVGGVGPWSRR